MGRFEKADRDHRVDVREALRRAHEEVARNRGESPPPDERDEVERAREALRDHDQRLSQDD